MMGLQLNAFNEITLVVFHPKPMILKLGEAGELEWKWEKVIDMNYYYKIKFVIKKNMKILFSSQKVIHLCKEALVGSLFASI